MVSGFGGNVAGLPIEQSLGTPHAGVETGRLRKKVDGWSCDETAALHGQQTYLIAKVLYYPKIFHPFPATGEGSR